MDIEIRQGHYLVLRNPFRSIIIQIMITTHHRVSTFLTASLHYDSFWWRVSTCLLFVCSLVCLLFCLFFVCDAFCLLHVFRLKTETKPYFELLRTAPQDTRFSRYCCFNHCHKSNDLHITQKHCLF